MVAIIITGINRGLGEALFDLLLERENILLIGASRKFTSKQKEVALKNTNVVLSDLDLLDSKMLDQFKPVIENCKQENVEKIYFFNNAGIVTPIGAIGQLNPEEIQDSFQVNMVAPSILANALAQVGKPLEVVNVSSGAANNTITGWGVYCAAKAGVKMFFDVMNTQGGAVEIVHINPGIMDTGMQTDIRNSASDGFPRLEDFKSFKEKGDLKKPLEVAQDIVKQLKL